MKKNDKNFLLTPKQMAKADILAVKAGVPSIDLMENAGKAVFKVIEENYSPCKILVLCGPGNNGGDGFVIARLLEQKGWEVELALMGDVARIRGDAKINSLRFKGKIKDIDVKLIEKVDLIVDALFGAGLDRDIAGDILKLVKIINQSKTPVISVDIPSGIDGASGQVRGDALKAKHTITFFRAKPAHYLLPGREYCANLHVEDIGIPESVLEEIGVTCWLNTPNNRTLPKRKLSNHKYDAGHCIIISGDELHTGASRLAARAALRIGAGLVSLGGKKSALLIHATHLTSIMLKETNDAKDISRLLEDKRLNSIVLGMGLGVTEQTRDKVLAALNSNANVVVDADGLSSFAKNPKQLFDAIKARKANSVVLTPHDGEFKRIFDIDEISKVEKAKQAAKISGAIIVLKGADSVVATPDGKAVINNNAPPNLATAGSGDVLAGMIGGLLAQGMIAFQAAQAGVYLHGEAGVAFGGAGLIADDLPDILPSLM